MNLQPLSSRESQTLIRAVSHALARNSHNANHLVNGLETLRKQLKAQPLSVDFRNLSPTEADLLLQALEADLLSEIKKLFRFFSIAPDDQSPETSDFDGITTSFHTAVRTILDLQKAIHHSKDEL